jgi:hypothetical protein
MSGTSSARITYTGTAFNYTGVGYIDFGAFTLNGSNLTSRTTGVNNDYKLYATFTQNFACSSFLAPGVSCGVTGINLNLYADAIPATATNAQINAMFSQSTVNSDPTVTPFGTAVLLGTVDKVIAGQAGLDALGGAFQNVNTDFALTAAGKTFFVSPDPFYSFAFSAFNNTSQGLQCNGNTNVATGGAANGCAGVITSLAINSESGFTDFNVPEPASVAIFGAGLLGLGFLRRRKS